MRCDMEVKPNQTFNNLDKIYYFSKISSLKYNNGPMEYNTFDMKENVLDAKITL